MMMIIKILSAVNSAAQHDNTIAIHFSFHLMALLSVS